MARSVSGLFSGPAAALFLLAILALILIPYFLLGSSLEEFAAELFREQTSRFILAGFGVFLLAADVLLPVPSSLVASGLGAALGWAWGTVAGAVGLTVGCMIGFGLGRSAGQHFVRAQPDRNDAYVSALLQRYGVAALALCRGVPVLGEASVIAAGAFGMPAGRCLAVTTLANIGVSGIYAVTGAAAWDVSPVAAFAAALLLPALFLAGAAVARRILAPRE
jgi:uncharacterized membrane protein YdjX (TVP38/TMEM64 family)